jgi:tripartite-type tricarboxylate transporter receptor subunit TctC
VIASLHAAVGRAMADAGMKRQLTSLGIEPSSSSPEEFAALIRSELPKWAKIVKASGAQVE